MKKIDKEILKNFYLLNKSIGETEDDIINPWLIAIKGYLEFKDIREKFNNLYKLFDIEDIDFNLLSFVEQIVDDNYSTFEFEKLTENEKEELTNEDWFLAILKKDEEKYPHCVKKFKNLDEVVDYVIDIYNNSESD